MFRMPTVLCFTFIFSIATSNAQVNLFTGYEHLFTEPLKYVVGHTDDSLIMDGKGEEAAWQKATWSALFTDIEGKLRPAPPLATRFKMLWNNEKLFILAELEEPHIWANLKKHDQIVYYDPDFEVFIDPDDDSQHYFEIEINALNTIFDLFLPRPYRDGGPAVISWNAAGLKSAVFVDGTINDSRDTDKKWTLEMAIPFQNISLGTHTRVPKHGDYFRINFSRVEWDVQAKGHGYEKKINPSTNNPYPEHNWVWSPQGIVNMHYPERWGYAFFSNENPGTSDTSFSLPQDRMIRNFLWLCYYKQKSYKNDRAKYADNLRSLALPEKSVVLEKREFIVSCDCDPTRFLISATDKTTGELWQINEQGIILEKETKSNVKNTAFHE